MSKLPTILILSIAIISIIIISSLGYVIWSAIDNHNSINYEDTNNNVSKDSNIDIQENTNSDVNEHTNSDMQENTDSDVNENTNSDALDSNDNHNDEIDLLSQLNNALEKPTILNLTYHHIDLEPDNNPVTVTPAQFEAHISALQKSEYQPVTYEQITRFITISDEARKLMLLSRLLTPAEEQWISDSITFVKTLPEQGFHITFDDGYKSVYQYAVPILLEAKLPMTFFVITKSSNKEWETAPYYINYPHVTWEELQIIQRYPQFQVQSHTYSLHSYEPGDGSSIPSLSGRIFRADLGRVESHEEFLERIYQDMILSKSYLQNRLNPHRVTGMSYPYGVYTDDVIEMAAKADIQYLFTNQPDLVTYRTSATAIPRLHAGDPDISARKLLALMEQYFSN
jgi:biofilm PGA synthesis lipoprotein PgaB